MFGCKVPGEEITDLEEAEIKEFLHSHIPQLENLEQLTSLTERDDQEDSDAVAKLPSSALKKGLQMADDLVSHVFEVNHFINRC